MSNQVTVFGSYIVALFMTGGPIPQPGETVVAKEFFEGPGGKGSNQAIAASRAGARTGFLAKIGNDKYGNDALTMYRENNVDTSLILVDEEAPTGIGFVTVDPHGENAISITLGANDTITSSEIDTMIPKVADTNIIGFQLENNVDAVEYAIKRARKEGITTLLDPAPVKTLSSDIYQYIDYLKPNEYEASQLSGIKVDSKDNAAKACSRFLEKGVRNVIITLGKEGCVFMGNDKKTPHFLEAYSVDKVVDTTGAGDSFSGALMAELSRGSSLEEAIAYSLAAAALSVTKFSVVDALPTEKEIRQFMKRSS
jgi:ribokinase